MKFSVVTCSIDDLKYERLKKSIAQSFREPVQILRIGNAGSLAQGYNLGLRQATGDIIIFCHDDIEVLTFNLDDLLSEDATCFDIIGVAGTSLLITGNWIAAGRPFIHGQVAHQCKHADTSFQLCTYGSENDRVVTGNIQALDGLFLAAKREVLLNVKFDEECFDGFHLYDLDFTYNAHLRGYRMAVDERIHLIHGSGGRYDRNWRKYVSRFDRKYHRHLGRRGPGEVRSFEAAYYHDRQLLRNAMESRCRS